MCGETNERSSTSITLKIKDVWFNKFSEEEQKNLIKKMVSNLNKEGVANDINGYPKAPPSFRVWGGGTVEPEDINTLLPWIEWAYSEVKSKYA